MRNCQNRPSSSQRCLACGTTTRKPACLSTSRTNRHVNTMRRTRGTFSSVAEFVAVHETGLPRTPYVGSIRLPRPPWASIPTPVAPLVGSSVFRCTKPMRNNKIVTCSVRALTTSAGDEPVLSTAHTAIELGEVVTPCSSGENKLLWHVASQADHQRRPRRRWRRPPRCPLQTFKSLALDVYSKPC